MSKSAIYDGAKYSLWHNLSLPPYQHVKIKTFEILDSKKTSLFVENLFWMLSPALLIASLTKINIL